MLQLTDRAARSTDADRLLTLWLLLRSGDVNVDVARLDGGAIRAAALGAIRELATALGPGIGEAANHVVEFLTTDLGGVATP